MTPFRKLQCLALPGDLPEAIVVDITKLKIGDAIRVKSIEYPGVTILDPANAVVVSVKMARGAAQEEEEEEEEASATPAETASEEA